MNVYNVLTKNYEKRTLGQHGKNEPKTNPNEPNSKPISANEMPKRTQSKPNTNPIYHGIAYGEAGTNPIYSELAESISKWVSTRESDVVQLPAHSTFSANILPGRAL